MSDPVARSDELDRRILAIPADQVFTKRVVVAGFATVLLALGAVLGVLVRFTSDTRRAVGSEIPALQDQVEDRDATIADLEDINGQAVDEVVRLATLLQQNGIDPGTIRIQPTTTVPDG